MYNYNKILQKSKQYQIFYLIYGKHIKEPTNYNYLQIYLQNIFAKQNKNQLPPIYITLYKGLTNFASETATDYFN